MEEVLAGLDTAYNELQRLQVPPTKQNLVILMAVMQAMEDAYSFIREHNPEDKTDE